MDEITQMQIESTLINKNVEYYDIYHDVIMGK